jgi:iron complex transport system permease protein
MAHQVARSDALDPAVDAVFSFRSRLGLLAALGAGLVAVSAVALAVGAYRLSVVEVWTTVLARLGLVGATSPASRLHDTVVWNMRLPRIVMAITVGAALSSSGAIFQGCFRNPLVEPYILGVSSGAAFGAALGIIYPWFPLSVQLSAFAFAALAVTIVYLLARVRGEPAVVTLVLAGVIVGAVFAAGVSMLTYLATNVQMREIVFWLMGGLYFSTWRDVAIAAPLVGLGVGGMYTNGWRLNVLSMGDQEARSLGVHPERVRRFLIVLATLVTATTVSSVGVIAWVGLMMPHAARLLVGPDNRFVIPCAVLLGSIYLVLCDTLARTLTTSEIPVGIITSLVGAPYLAYLLRSRTRGLFG